MQVLPMFQTLHGNGLYFCFYHISTAPPRPADGPMGCGCHGFRQTIRAQIPSDVCGIRLKQLKVTSNIQLNKRHAY